LKLPRRSKRLKPKTVADKNEQEEKAALKKRQIEDEALAEKERRDLYNLQAEC